VSDAHQLPAEPEKVVAIDAEYLSGRLPQPELGLWVEGSRSVGTDWTPPVLEGWEAPQH